MQLYKKETLAQVFSCEFSEISKNTFFTEHIWATASSVILKRIFLLDVSFNHSVKKSSYWGYFEIFNFKISGY